MLDKVKNIIVIFYLIKIRNKLDLNKSLIPHEHKTLNQINISTENIFLIDCKLKQKNKFIF